MGILLMIFNLKVQIDRNWLVSIYKGLEYSTVHVVNKICIFGLHH